MLSTRLIQGHYKKSLVFLINTTVCAKENRGVREEEKEVEVCEGGERVPSSKSQSSQKVSKRWHLDLEAE